MASISGSSSPGPIRGDSKGSREATLKISSGKEVVITAVSSSPSGFFSRIGRLFPTPMPSSPPLSDRSISPVSGGDGTGSPISEIAFAVLEIEKKESFSEKSFSGTHGPFTCSNFGPFAKDDESYRENIRAIFKSPGDRIKFNLEDFDAVTGSKLASSSLLVPIGLKPLDKLLRQLYLDVSRDESITIFGKTFSKDNFSNPSDQTSCKEELKTFIQDQLKKESISEPMALRIVNCLHQGIQAPLLGIVNLVFNKTTLSVSSTLEASIMGALQGVPIDSIGNIEWEKIKEAPFNRLDINLVKTPKGIKLETTLFIKLKGSGELGKDRYEAKLTIEDLASGLSFVEIKKV